MTRTTLLVGLIAAGTFALSPFASAQHHHGGGGGSHFQGGHAGGFQRGGGFNRGGGVVIGGAGKGRVIVDGGNFNSTSITISNGEYTIKARQGDVTYFVSGDLNGAGKEKFAIQEGEKKNEYEDIKKVPEKHRAALEELVKMVSK